MTWFERAACSDVDTNLFFAERHDSNSVTAAAKKVCEGCLVRAECLAEAMSDVANIIGTWGGLTHDERRKLHRRSISVRTENTEITQR